MSGYPVEMFVEPLEGQLMCGVCRGVMNEPTATSCGHVFCFKCLEACWSDCPLGCGQVDAIQNQSHLARKIDSLLTYCKYSIRGCKAILQLADREEHQKKCHYSKKAVGKTNSFSLFNFGSQQQEESKKVSKGHTRSKSVTSTLKSKLVESVQRRHTRNNSLGNTKALQSLKKAASISDTEQSKPIMMQSQHTFRLKRTKPKESLGLVLITGDKMADGRPASFLVKDINKDTLAHRAGVKPGDKIVQVDYYNISAIPPQEAVARIKDKTLVTLTILRGLVAPSRNPDHIYDEILYADQLSQPESQLLATGLLPTGSRASRRRGADVFHTTGEKGSKDSGLSSGSSNSPEHQKPRQVQDVPTEHPIDPQFERVSDIRQSYRTEREMATKFLKSRHTRGTSLEPGGSCRIEGDFEVEEICLKKRGTSQLGVTLGYDTRGEKGHLYVCEILPTGLAYQNGRLQCGDIIRRVNGFEVFDPEEAILLFLEQDQDITLTVARRIKAVSNRLVLAQEPLPVEHTYAVLEEVTGRNKASVLRRTDSCGSLDSHSHKYATLTPPAPLLSQPPPVLHETGYEYMSSRQVGPRISPPRNYSPLCHNLGPRSLSPRSPLSNPSQPSHTPSPDLIPHHTRVGSHDQPAPSRDRLHTTGRYERCHSNQGVRKAKSVRALNDQSYSKLLKRTESSGQIVANRIESLV